MKKADILILELSTAVTVPVVTGTKVDFKTRFIE